MHCWSIFIISLSIYYLNLYRNHFPKYNPRLECLCQLCLKDSITRLIKQLRTTDFRFVSEELNKNDCVFHCCLPRDKNSFLEMGCPQAFVSMRSWLGWSYTFSKRCALAFCQVLNFAPYTADLKEKDDEFILFFKIVLGKIASAAMSRINSAP